MKIPTNFLFRLALSASLFIQLSCNKDAKTEWDTDILLPLAEASFSIDDLVADSNIISQPGQPLVLRFVDEFELIPKDSLLVIPDTMITDGISFPVSFDLPSGFQVANISQLVRFSFRDMQLTNAILESGYAEFSVKNYLNDEVTFNYSFPKLTYAGVPLSIQNEVASAGSADAPSTFTRTLDLAGHGLDLRGDQGIQANQIRFLLDATLNPEGIGAAVIANVDFIEYQNRFYNLKPYYAQGYLGRYTFDFSDGTDLAALKKISGMIELEDLQLDLVLENGVGADFKLNIQNVTGFRGSQSLALSHPIIQSTESIARAQHVAYQGKPYRPTIKNYTFTSANSNLKQVVELLPERLSYAIQAELNPLGNISSGNDFFYSSSNIKLKTTLEFPLKFSAQAVTYVDTVKTEGIEQTETYAYRKGELRVIAHNQFPLDMSLEIRLLDENKELLGVIVPDQTISAGQVNSELRVEQASKSVIVLPVTDAVKLQLEKARYIAFKGKFQTQPTTELLPIYADYRLKLQVVGDGTYRVRIN